MAQPNRLPVPNSEPGDDYVDGFEVFFDEANDQESQSAGMTANQAKVLLDKLTELVTISVDQKVETSKIASQIMDNQRQLIATQQILISLMDKSLELTRHVTAIEERLPSIYELPRLVESLRQRVAQLEGIEIS
ncbi:hypothetical protein KA183_05970 [bacterium]|nr:hypothetical protein [bacterium]QQR56340.1 MAG: hypothetical protein IPG59_15170 [Candidatus Melainabacteria bacterium]